MVRSFSLFLSLSLFPSLSEIVPPICFINTCIIALLQFCIVEITYRTISCRPVQYVA
jgi:hypothetical protein